MGRKKHRLVNIKEREGAIRMFSYTFWIRRVMAGNNKLYYPESAHAITVAGNDFLDAFKKFIQKYAAVFEICINGLSNRESTIDLSGETIVINCLTVKFINQITLINGKLVIVPTYDCYIMRANLCDVQIRIQPKLDGKLIVSGSKCKEVIFIGDNIYFDGPIDGQYTLLDNKGEERPIHTSQLKTLKQTTQTAEAAKVNTGEPVNSMKESIPADIYQEISISLGTTDMGIIWKEYKRRKIY